MNNSLYISYIIFLLASVFTTASANEIATADSAYNEGDYNAAIAGYIKVSEEQGVSAPLLFNLGNAYYQAGDYGLAMLCYQRAHRLDPSKKEIKRNLNFLSEKIEDANKAEQHGKRLKVTEDDMNFFQSLKKSISENTASNTWAVWSVVCFLIFAGCVALYLFTSEVLLRKAGFFGGLVLLGISMICIVFAYMGAAAGEEHDYGVITAYKVTLLTEPSRNSKEGEVLTRGTKIKIVSEETDAEGVVIWYKVRLNSDYIGWLPADELAVI